MCKCAVNVLGSKTWDGTKTTSLILTLKWRWSVWIDSDQTPSWICDELPPCSSQHSLSESPRLFCQLPTSCSDLRPFSSFRCFSNSLRKPFRAAVDKIQEIGQMKPMCAFFETCVAPMCSGLMGSTWFHLWLCQTKRSRGTWGDLFVFCFLALQGVKNSTTWQEQKGQKRLMQRE